MSEKEKQAKIVVIGGGTGLSTMLRGLKKKEVDLTAVVSVADDGGGSGVLRREMHILPPGDIRNCILALSEAEPVMEKLLHYRFRVGSLTGQNFGNLFLAAMNEISDGDFACAVQNMCDVLKVKGAVFPVTQTDVDLVAIMENGQRVVGESSVGEAMTSCDCRIDNVFLQAKKEGEQIEPLAKVKNAIEEADLIVLGPGSLYTSVLPNLVVPGMVEMIDKAKAPVVYINNIMTQPGETDGYTAYDHAEAILHHTHENFLDYCIVNCQTVQTPLLARYKDQEAEEVALDEERFEKKDIRLIRENLVGIVKDRYIRHDTEVLADVIMKLLEEI